MTKALVAVLGVCVLVSTGCEYDGKVASENTKRVVAREGAAPINYQEVTYEGRIYVVSTSDAADKARKGIHPATTVTKIGGRPEP